MRFCQIIGWSPDVSLASGVQITEDLLWLVMCLSSFTALIRSVFPFIPAEFAFLGSALIRFLEFLSVSVSLLGREQEKSTQARKKQKSDKWLFYSLRAVVFPLACSLECLQPMTESFAME